MIKLTKRGRFILEKMRDEEEELVVFGNQVWCGLEKTNIQTFYFFLRNMLISSDGSSENYFVINDSGRRLLNGETKIYPLANGEYVENIFGEK